MLSALASTPEGEKVLYESDCCSYQFLKSLASSLLNALTDLKSDELQEDRINREHRKLCAMEMVRLVHLVCSSDRFIDEHKSECYHTFIGSLTKGHEAFKGTNVEDLLLDLLEYEGVTEEDLS
ncbi:PREDICTED: uncharacterized protein LOC105313887 [Amphimedon queenslandica]|nr:PREDICTED: uncharacterized protein LOC105313887 [Amphimedon queenslandica]|eukprot:XP_011405970.1 PREDICTED: uncharacterized protein LOC105313887 [Amphimedon queenslandica]